MPEQGKSSQSSSEASVLFLRENTETGARTHTSPCVWAPSLQGLGRRNLWALVTALPLWAALAVSAAQAQVPVSNRTPAPFAGASISEWRGEVHVQIPGASPA